MEERDRLAREREQENASELQFGRDFEKEKCLMNAQALRIMQKINQEERPRDLNSDPKGIRIQKFMDYTMRFDRFRNPEFVDQAKSILENDTGYHSFEVAQLGNLFPDKADEAINIIPSLQKRNQETLQLILNEISEMQK